MKTTLSTTQAAHLLIDDTNANWSRLGAFALVEYLEDFEENEGREINFCRCSIRVDFSEYKSLEDFALEYFGSKQKVAEKFNCGDEYPINEQIREFIRDYGTLIEFDGGIIVSAF